MTCKAKQAMLRRVLGGVFLPAMVQPRGQQNSTAVLKQALIAMSTGRLERITSPNFSEAWDADTPS